MSWRAGAALALLSMAGWLASGCVRTSDGVPIESGEAAPTTRSTAPATPQPTARATAQPEEDAQTSAPGVVATTRRPIPPDTVTCSQPIRPAVEAIAVVPDPQAPRITVAVPDGWTSSAGSGDVGLSLTGPAGMSATVTITPTQSDPAAAYTEYADLVLAQSPVSSVSVLPAELCEYSGQKLMGAWSDNPQQSVEFLDRIVHVWTGSKDYLVAVHAQAPGDTAGFDAASKVVTEDLAVGIP